MMGGLLTEAFATALVAGAVTAGIPLLLAALGEQISEKAGVLNVGLEGMMLMGAFTGFSTALATGSIWAGFAAGAVAGVASAGIMAVLCVLLGLNQIVIGIALTLGAEGLTALLHHFRFARSYPSLGVKDSLRIPLLSDIPVVGRGLFDHHPMAYVAVILVFAMAALYRRTGLGLSLRAAGEKSAALDVAGVDVFAVRSFAVLATGALAGIGGAFMAEVGAGIFVPFLTSGNGFIAIVLAMLARGRPTWVMAGAFLFGACLSMATALQVAGVNLPTDVIQMLPFAAVMIVLVIFGRRAGLPAELGVPYVRGQR